VWPRWARYNASNDPTRPAPIIVQGEASVAEALAAEEGVPISKETKDRQVNRRAAKVVFYGLFGPTAKLKYSNPLTDASRLEATIS
jgi:hypothetical protein